MRVVTWLVALLVGLVYGVAGTLGAGSSWGWFPLGLVIAVIGAIALLAAVRLLTSDRWSALAVGGGMVTAAVLFSGRGPGGSVVVPQPVDGGISAGMVWLFAVFLAAAVVVGWPTRTAVAAART